MNVNVKDISKNNLKNPENKDTLYAFISTVVSR